MGDATSTTDTAALARAAADLLDRHPDLPPAMVTIYQSGTTEIDWHLRLDPSGADDQRETMRHIRRSIGGTWDKDSYGDTFHLSRKVDGIKLAIVAAREQVCERVVVGTETVTVPAVEAQPERVEEREIVEWRCDPVAADPEAVNG